MIVETAKIEATFRKVKQIKEYMQQYCIAPDRAKLSVEDLQRCVSDMYSIKIEKREVLFEGEYLRGLVERYADRARILLRAGQGEEWMRFTATKELCHLAIDEKEDWSPRGHETIQSLLIEERLDLDGDEAAQKARKLADSRAQSEKLAEIAAGELMYPHEFRDGDIEAIAKGTTTLKALAMHFHAPAYIIGVAHHPNRIHIANLGWELANSAKVVEPEKPAFGDKLRKRSQRGRS
jgi:hypothetical protein